MSDTPKIALWFSSHRQEAVRVSLRICPKYQHMHYHYLEMPAHALSLLGNASTCIITTWKYQHMYYHYLEMPAHVLSLLGNASTCIITTWKCQHMYYHYLEMPAHVTCRYYHYSYTVDTNTCTCAILNTVFVTFQYLTVLCIPAISHVTFQYIIFFVAK